MLSADERRAAEQLALALDGDPGAADEARELALLLSGAAGAARIDIPGEEVERALAGTRLPRPGTERTRRRARPLAAAAVAVAVVAALALPLLRSSPTVDVQARAAGAIDRRAVIHVVSRITSPTGVLPSGGLTTWIDHGGGRERVRLTRTDDHGIPLVDVLSTPGRYLRYQVRTRTAVTGPSCRVVASGCAELLDPVELYRQALLRNGIGNARKVTTGDGQVYRFALPLPGSVGRPGIHQVVSLDAETFLPRTIEWRDSTGTVAVISVALVEQLAPDALPAGVFRLPLAADTHVRQVDASGAEVRLLDHGRITLAALRSSSITTAWLGEVAGGWRLQRIDVFKYTAGIAVRYRYGDATVWTYDQVVPPVLRAGHLSPVKILEDGRSPVHFYQTDGGGAVAERDLRDVTVAVVAPALTKIDVLQLISRARPL
jgi:hypothetical protein